MIDLAVHELVSRLLRHQTRDFIISHSINDPDNNGIYAVIDYLHNHLKDEVNIDQLCKLACMSRTKFFDEFKQLLGVTPQACFAFGYASASHFSRRFKAVYGLSPSQYKARHNKCANRS